MYSLAEKLSDPSGFVLGIELVTTRGTMADAQAMHTRAFAAELVRSNDIDWVSITDNAGGNPQLSPTALGKPILYGGREVVIHLSCKDFNRNGLESAAWELASEGFHNILALGGDYPAAGYHGRGKPVFDIDSIGLLTMQLVERLTSKAGRTCDQIIIDPGLAPVGADTYGLVNMGLDAMRRIRSSPDLAGAHLSVGLTNFSFGIPRPIRESVESAYLTLAVQAGLDFVLANPEKRLELLAPANGHLRLVGEALECGRPLDGETQEEAGFRQAAKIIELFADE